MKAFVAVAVIGVLGFAATVFDPAREMLAQLILSVVPLLLFMMWPVRDEAADAGSTRKKVA